MGRSKGTPDRVGTLLGDGRIEVDGRPFDEPSEAARILTGHPTNGWWFFLVQQKPRRSLRHVWREYVEALAMEGGDDTDVDEEENES